MAATQREYVRTDEHGVMRVGEMRVMMDGVIYAFLDGNSAESIREQFPSLSLEEVYGAITFFLANRQQVLAYLRRQEEITEEWKRKLEEIGALGNARLRALIRAHAGQSS